LSSQLLQQPNKKSTTEKIHSLCLTHRPCCAALCWQESPYCSSHGNFSTAWDVVVVWRQSWQEREAAAAIH